MCALLATSSALSKAFAAAAALSSQRDPVSDCQSERRRRCRDAGRQNASEHRPRIRLTHSLSLSLFQSSPGISLSLFGCSKVTHSLSRCFEVSKKDIDEKKRKKKKRDGTRASSSRLWGGGGGGVLFCQLACIACISLGHKRSNSFLSLSLFGCRFVRKKNFKFALATFGLRNSASSSFTSSSSKTFYSSASSSRERESAQKKTRRVHGFETCLFLRKKESRERKMMMMMMMMREHRHRR